MPYVFHDSYKTQPQATKAGKDIMKLGLANGVKLTKTGKKSRPFMLYILPLKKRGAKKS